jgi:hypothetical protein
MCACASESNVRLCIHIYTYIYIDTHTNTYIYTHTQHTPVMHLYSASAAMRYTAPLGLDASKILLLDEAPVCVCVGGGERGGEWR